MRVISFFVGLFLSILVIAKVGPFFRGIIGDEIILLASFGFTGSFFALTKKPRTSIVFFLLTSIPLILTGYYIRNEDMLFFGSLFVLPFAFEIMEILREKKKYSLSKKTAQLEEIEEMNGVQFEDRVVETLEAYGFRVEKTPATGDKGIDIIIYLRGKKICLQLKHWKDKVGGPVVRDAYGSKALNRCDKFFILTTHGFSSRAVEAAKKLNIHLITYEELLEQLEEWYRQNPFLKG